jgi:hypothetical protein
MIKVTVSTDTGVVTKEINMSRTLSGDFLLKEHPEIDIIVSPTKHKVILLPKGEYNEVAVKAQNGLLDHLKKKGVILPETIRGSNIFGGVECLFPKKSVEKAQDTIQVTVYVISEFLESERPKHEFAKEYEKAFHDTLTNPSVDQSTELGEIPQEEFKGSIPKSGFPNKAIYRYTY